MKSKKKEKTLRKQGFDYQGKVERRQLKKFSICEYSETQGFVKKLLTLMNH